MTALYRRLLGDRFEELPGAVRALHDVSGPVTWCGIADVTRGTNVAARMLATLFGLPCEGRGQALTVTFAPDGLAEIWTRDFAGRRFVSRQWACGALVCERIGPVVLRMMPCVDRTGLGLVMAGGRLLGLPLPRWLLPRIHTREFDDAGRYRFEVEASLPGIGRLVRYEGALAPLAR